jgi:hypothetical protein
MHSIEYIIDKQLKRLELQRKLTDGLKEGRPLPRPVITITRQLGARGEEFAERLAEMTGFHLFDRDILDAIARDFGVRDRMIELLDEKSQSELESWFLGIMTGHIIDQSDYIASLTKIVGSLVKFGDAILVGRGTHIIIGPQKGFHIGIVAPDPVRVAVICAKLRITEKEAAHTIVESDTVRAHFIKKSFGADINDPSIYDLIINTSSIAIDDAAELAFTGYIKKEKFIGGRK